MPGDGKVIVTAWEGSELNVDTDRELTDNAIKKTNQQNHGSIDLCGKNFGLGYFFYGKKCTARYAKIMGKTLMVGCEFFLTSSQYE
jgi:hypothetical protein